MNSQLNCSLNISKCLCFKRSKNRKNYLFLTDSSETCVSYVIRVSQNILCINKTQKIAVRLKYK